MPRLRKVKPLEVNIVPTPADELIAENVASWWFGRPPDQSNMQALVAEIALAVAKARAGDQREIMRLRNRLRLS
jgi:hypothetical protein